MIWGATGPSNVPSLPSSSAAAACTTAGTRQTDNTAHHKIRITPGLVFFLSHKRYKPTAAKVLCIAIWSVSSLPKIPG